MNHHVSTNAEKSNKKYIDFNLSINKKLNDICEPFLTHFNLSGFIYVNFISHDKRVFISTNHTWVNTYISNSLYEDKTHNKVWQELIFSNQGNIRYALWSSFEKTEVFKAAYLHGMYNGLFIVDGYELFSFPSKLHAPHDTLLYLNNLKDFERFISFFKSKIDGVIKISPDVAITTNSLTSSHGNNLLKQKVNHVKCNNYLHYSQKKFFLNKNCNKTYITNAEFECIVHLSKGKTLKEVANTLDISMRTVETYVNNAKNRLGCFSKTALLNSIQNSELRTLL